MKSRRTASALAVGLMVLGGCGGEDEPESQLTAAQAEEVATGYIEAGADCPDLVADPDLCGGFGRAGLPEEVADVTSSELEGDEALVRIEPADDSGPVVVTLAAEGEQWKVATWQSE